VVDTAVLGRQVGLLELVVRVRRRCGGRASGERFAGALETLSGLLDRGADPLAGLLDRLVQRTTRRRAGALEPALRRRAGFVESFADGSARAAFRACRGSARAVGEQQEEERDQ